MLQKLAINVDNTLERMGFKPKHKALFWHYCGALKDQVLAVVPISLLLILAMLIFFRTAPEDFGLQVMGLVSAMIGLMFFVDGLRILVMPLGELVGEELPKKYPMVIVLLVAFCLGVLVTYAEPAVASLQPLAALVDRERAPYLFFMLNEHQELMVLCIGLGVGIAAVVGTLRFVNGWSLKPLIAVAMVPTMGLSCYMWWGNKDLRPMLGLAWDCGAVTTGPVTVPILLALGIGVMKSQRQKKLANAVLSEVVDHGEGQALEGFGIVTLASLFPIMMVLLLGVTLSIIYDKDEVMEQVRGYVAKTDGLQSPLKEVVSSFRSILPLVFALFFIVCVVLWRAPPQLTLWVPVTGAGKGDDDDTDDEDATIMAAAVEMTAQEDHKSFMPRRHTKGAKEEAKVTSSEVSVPLDEGAEEKGKSEAKKVKKVASEEALFHEAEALMDEREQMEMMYEEHEPRTGLKSMVAYFAPMILGFIFVQGGMILFNIGLTYGFTQLGDQAGELFPAAFMEVEGVEASPYYSFAVGILIVELLVFSLGVLATRAEPALNVLGGTVEHLSGGTFSKKLLLYCVSLGVGVGMAIGAIKILFGFGLIWILLIKYAIACTLTVFCTEDYVNIAWDSAGVTTGPVTVPFVLAIGIGFSAAANAAEGFGMLTAASVAPIVMVQAMSLIRRATQHWGQDGGGFSFSSLFSKRSSHTKLATDEPEKTERDVDQDIEEADVKQP